MELQLLTESMLSARKAIEEAFVQVREQKENFDFARERYEKLMPLVETGALEPLAVSQIESAYISARASLAQAKYLPSQATRDLSNGECEALETCCGLKEGRGSSRKIHYSQQWQTKPSVIFNLAQSTYNATPASNNPPAHPPQMLLPE
jgi:hypothetical protein